MTLELSYGPDERSSVSVDEVRFRDRQVDAALRVLSDALPAGWRYRRRTADMHTISVEDSWGRVVFSVAHGALDQAIAEMTAYLKERG